MYWRNSKNVWFYFIFQNTQALLVTRCQVLVFEMAQTEEHCDKQDCERNAIGAVTPKNDYCGQKKLFFLATIEDLIIFMKLEVTKKKTKTVTKYLVGSGCKKFTFYRVSFLRIVCESCNT